MPTAEMQVEVIRSARRKKTVQARVVDGTLRVSIPAHFSPTEEEEWVKKMQIRIARQTQAGTVDLDRRTAALTKAHELPTPNSIAWSDRQNTRWGSCTPATGNVRISSAVAAFPSWVVDYVIVHELAHLLEPNHSAQFWEIVNRYPRAERARGFLIAKSYEPDEHQTQ